LYFDRVLASRLYQYPSHGGLMQGISTGSCQKPDALIIETR
jgi:hypothetical protein